MREIISLLSEYPTLSNTATQNIVAIHATSVRYFGPFIETAEVKFAEEVIGYRSSKVGSSDMSVRISAAAAAAAAAAAGLSLSPAFHGSF